MTYPATLPTSIQHREDSFYVAAFLLSRGVRLANIEVDSSSGHQVWVFHDADGQAQRAWLDFQNNVAIPVADFVNAVLRLKATLRARGGAR